MRVGLILPLFSGDAGKVMAFARRAEDLGFDGVFAFDHFFPPGAPSDRPSLDAFSTLAAVAAATRRVSVGTLVTRASLRPAGLLAKMAAAIDHISGGRMIFGIGTGDPIDRPEADAYGFRMLGVEDRRAHLVETVSALKAMFQGEPWAGGRFVSAMTGPLVPPPATPGGPPVWVGGQSEEVVRLAAGSADGWNGWGLSIPEFAGRADLLFRTAEETGRAVAATWAGIVVVGRDQDEAGAMLEARYERGMLEANVWAGSVNSLTRWLQGLSRAGASWAALVPAGPSDRVEMIAEVVLPNLPR